MSTSELETFFQERFAEVETYVAFLQDLEDAARFGPPRLAGSTARITAPQQKILYSSVYLQLYNLVEATVSRCIEAITIAASEKGWRPDDLNLNLRNEWVRVMARTHTDLTPQHRLESAVAMCAHLIQQLPLGKFTLETGGGGTWDDDAIERVSARVGCNLAISNATRTAAKRHVRDDLGALKLVKNRRNRLAHGSMSFVECADGVTVTELSELIKAVGGYLREAIGCFDSYIRLFHFLRPDRQPAGAA